MGVTGWRRRGEPAQNELINRAKFPRILEIYVKLCQGAGTRCGTVFFSWTFGCRVVLHCPDATVVASATNTNRRQRPFDPPFCVVVVVVVVSGSL